jgi:hypothetical protein
MVLSHSRKTAVVWSLSMDQLAWHHVHNEAYRRLGGVAAVNRIDYVPGHIIDLMCPTSLCGRDPFLPPSDRLRTRKKAT